MPSICVSEIRRHVKEWNAYSPDSSMQEPPS